jgi:hypothetical protein
MKTKINGHTHTNYKTFWQEQLIPIILHSYSPRLPFAQLGRTAQAVHPPPPVPAHWLSWVLPPEHLPLQEVHPENDPANNPAVLVVGRPLERGTVL